MTMEDSGHPVPSSEGSVRRAGPGESDPDKALGLPSSIAESQSPGGLPPDWKDRITLATIAGCMIMVAIGWYLLKEFAPLLLAVFLCYVIFPSHRWLTRRIPAWASIFVLVGAQ
jgi:hypothetical protein